MLKLKLAETKRRPLRLLCIGAHSDDIEIGCGGTIMRLLEEHDAAEVHWIVLGSSGKRNGEAEASATKFLKGAKSSDIIIEGFEDGFFPYLGGQIKSFFEKIKGLSPDLIFTHYRQDLHQDHRLASELTWNTFRDQLILEYEIIKYDGDLGVPNFYVHLSEPICRKKVDNIMKTFRSQERKDWFTSDSLYSMLRIRGIESKSPEKYAEGFYGRKLVF